MIEACPKCGGTAILVQLRDGFEEIPDLSSPTGKVRLPVKVEEFRCRNKAANMNLRGSSGNQLTSGGLVLPHPCPNTKSTTQHPLTCGSGPRQ